VDLLRVDAVIVILRLQANVGAITLQFAGMHVVT
jgi:hypothetical protein